MAESLSQPENSIDDDEGVSTMNDTTTFLDQGHQVALEYKDIKIGRDVLPYQSSPGCFWSNFAEAILRSSSQKVLIKRYHGSDESKTTQAFLRDLKALKYAR
ncbi:hypothetical protein FRC02_007935 [Tulasnella sp. 418]|nr:hypothetical protein FRC02_007935 [Tulasnella sp. 418]